MRAQHKQQQHRELCDVSSACASMLSEGRSQGSGSCESRSVRPASLRPLLGNFLGLSDVASSEKYRVHSDWVELV